MNLDLSIVIKIYFLLLFVIGFLVMGIDKWKAINNRWRIPEKRLWLIAWGGGAAGTWLGMLLFHHKTRHPKFLYGFTILAIVEAFIILKV
ncbi:DUF1294 domain-containing protein [Rummeliibacillus sp. JY-2-4R]